MNLYVARHAQTNYNVQQLLNADPTVDVHLTATGIQQAQSLAEQLEDIPLDVIFITELPRTRETASYLKQYETASVIVDPRLNENDSGFEGRPVHEYLDAIIPHPDKWHAVFNDGESLSHVRDRVADFLESLHDASYKNVLVITHGYIMECIDAVINGLDFELAATFDVPQGAYTCYTLTHE